MSDLIDRDELLQQINLDSFGVEGSYGDTWKFLDTIENMPSAQPEPSTVWHNTYEEGFPPEGEQVLVTYDTSNSGFFWIDESIANDKGLRWSEDCDLWEKTKWAYFSDLLKAQPGTLQNLTKPNNGLEGWIPFHENPEQEGIYFVTVQCRHMEGYPDYELCYGEYTKDYGWDLFRAPIGWVDIVAWMSITKPAPYQPKEEAECTNRL